MCMDKKNPFCLFSFYLCIYIFFIFFFTNIIFFLLVIFSHKMWIFKVAKKFFLN